MRNPTPAEQPAIPGQQDPLFSLQPRCQLVWRICVGLSNIKSKQPQVCCKPRQPGAGSKTRSPKRSRTHTLERTDVKAFEYGIEAHPFVVSDDMGQADGSAVGQNEIHGRGRDSQRFEHLPNRHPAFKRKDRLSLLPFGRQEVVQLFVEPHVSLHVFDSILAQGAPPCKRHGERRGLEVAVPLIHALVEVRDSVTYGLLAESERLGLLLREPLQDRDGIRGVRAVTLKQFDAEGVSALFAPLPSVATKARSMRVHLPTESGFSWAA